MVPTGSFKVTFHMAEHPETVDEIGIVDGAAHFRLLFVVFESEFEMIVRLFERALHFREQCEHEREPRERRDTTIANQ